MPVKMHSVTASCCNRGQGGVLSDPKAFSSSTDSGKSTGILFVSGEYMVAQ